MARVGRPRTCDCGTCKKCKHRIYIKARYDAMSTEERREWIARRDPEKVRASELRRTMTPERQVHLRAQTVKTRRRNPLKYKARTAVSNAIRDGRLERGSCEQADGGACSGPVQAHHDDYSRPLDVRWLCRGHHWAEYKAHNRER